MDDRSAAGRIDNRIALIGAGGHGKSVINVARSAGYVVTSVFDDDPGRWGQDLLGAPVTGPISGVVACARALIAIADNRRRREISESYADVEWVRAIHAGAHVYPTAHVGPGTVILPSTVVGSDTFIGMHVIVSANCTVGHDTTVADYAHLAPGTHLAGNTHIGPGCFLGLGVVVTPGVRIGANTIVGAGSTVVKDLPADCTAIGSPARPLERR